MVDPRVVYCNWSSWSIRLWHANGNQNGSFVLFAEKMITLQFCLKSSNNRKNTKLSKLSFLPSSTPIIFPHELQYSANTPSKHLTQNGLPFFMMYRWPPRCVWHSAQQKWVTCQGLPSASVQFSDRISYKIIFTFYCNVIRHNIVKKIWNIY